MKFTDNPSSKKNHIIFKFTFIKSNKKMKGALSA